MARASRITDERLASLYEADGFGGEKTMRAKVIRELIDEIRALRNALAVLPREVGDAADGRTTDRAVHPVMVVAMEPGCKCSGAV